MKPEYLTRQKDIIPSDILQTPITIVGAGAIGSWTTLALAKMGFYNLKVYDFDIVDDENMNAQFYPTSALGKPKVEALKELIFDFTGEEITTLNQKVDWDTFFLGVVLSSVDSMDARKKIFTASKESGQVPFLIDPRMGGEYAQLHTVLFHDEKSVSSYEKTLISDDDAVQERCTAKATIYTANLLSGLVSKSLIDYLRKSNRLKSVEWDIAQNDVLLTNAQN